MNVQPPDKKKIDTFLPEMLVKDLEALTSQGKQGHYQSQLRLEAIQKLVDPALQFCDSDLRRILNKGHSPQLQRALRFYRKMRQLTILVEPVGEKTGPGCRVRLIPFEELTWETLLDTKFPLSLVRLQRVIKTKEQGRFRGEALLEDDEKELLQKIKPYFGRRKKPTLQSLAINLLNTEANCQGFSERALYNYLRVAREYRRKNQKGPSNAISMTIGGVEFFGKSSRRTVRETYNDMARAIVGMAKATSGSVDAFLKPALAFGGKLPFTVPGDLVSKTMEGIRNSIYQAVAPVFNTGPMFGRAISREILACTNLYKNLQR